jgi:glycosyltransferase involved in cell wall biosynthesis
MPFFSIIIPTYNRALFLKIAVESVLQQSFKDFELIIVDDGSTDSTRKIIEEYMGQSTKIKYGYQQNMGPAAARNRGLKEARGDYICFLDSDDRFRNDKLEITYQYIKKYTQYKIFHTQEIWYRKGKLLPHKKYHQKPEGFVFGQALKLCCISISTCCVKKEVFFDIGLFDEDLPVCEDYDFWLRVTAKYPVKLIPKFLTIKEGGHPDQQSKRYPALDKYRIYAIKKILEKGILNGNQKRCALNELKRKCRIYIKGAIKRNKQKEAKYYKNLLENFKVYVG